MVERAGDFLLAETRAVVALDEKSDTAAGVDMARAQASARSSVSNSL